MCIIFFQKKKLSILINKKILMILKKLKPKVKIFNQTDSL